VIEWSSEMGIEDVYRASRMSSALSMRRAIAASALASMRGSADAEEILRRNWPRDEEARLLIRAATTPTTAAANAGVISYDLIASFRSLAPGSAALRLFDASFKVDLTGINTVRLPRVAALNPLPVFVGEGAPAPAVQYTTAATTLGPTRKIMVLSGVTRELNEAMPDTAVTAIGRILADASQRSIDTTAFDTNPATSVRPAGLLNGVTPVTATSLVSDNFMAMSSDLSNLAQAVGNAGIDPEGLIYVAGPRETTIIRLRGSSEFTNPVLMTLGLPAKSVAAFAPAAVYAGYTGLPVIETAQEAAVHMEDTTPAEIVSTPGVKAAPVQSFFQQEIIGIKVRAWLAWAVAPGGAQVVNSVSW
jgi:hypothetical protein